MPQYLIKTNCSGDTYRCKSSKDFAEYSGESLFFWRTSKSLVGTTNLSRNNLFIKDVSALDTDQIKQETF